MRLKIIIPIFNPSDAFLETLSALKADGLKESVIVVDDGSTNRISQKIRDRFPNVEVLTGDGNLWWAGGMRMGMARALEHEADVICWLNHDCVPEPGTIAALAEEASKPGMGAVSAWCRSKDAPAYPVNPGFRKLTEIPVEQLHQTELVTVDGVNGNCVAINCQSIRSVGLPDAAKHPHYGDGPYTYRLHKAGYHNAVLTNAIAFLEREYDRCVSVKWRCAFWNKPLTTKLSYYFLSKKSQYHWKIKYHDSVAFRGSFLAPFAYFASMIKVLGEIVTGHRLRFAVSREARLEAVCRQYEGKFPKEGMIQALTKLEDDSN